LLLKEFRDDPVLPSHQMSRQRLKEWLSNSTWVSRKPGWVPSSASHWTHPELSQRWKKRMLYFFSLLLVSYFQESGNTLGLHLSHYHSTPSVSQK
jgi:hypothetical protein